PVVVVSAERSGGQAAGGERGASGLSGRRLGGSTVGATGVVWRGGGDTLIAAAKAVATSGSASRLERAVVWSDRAQAICSHPGPEQSWPGIMTMPACAKLATHANAVNARRITARAPVCSETRLTARPMPKLYVLGCLDAMRRRATRSTVEAGVIRRP